MKTSESIKNLSSALLKAQRNIGAAVKGAANPFFKSKYADLGSVMEACKSALNDQGITILQPVQSDSTGDFVETMLLHESGEFMSSNMKLVLSKQDMQAYGSAVSYARRYSLQSLVFIPAEDDDGERSMVRQHPKVDLGAKSAAIDQTNQQPVTVIQQTTIADVPKARTTFRKSTPSTIAATTTLSTLVAVNNTTTANNGALKSTTLNF